MNAKCVLCYATAVVAAAAVCVKEKKKKIAIPDQLRRREGEKESIQFAVNYIGTNYFQLFCIAWEKIAGE